MKTRRFVGRVLIIILASILMLPLCYPVSQDQTSSNSIHEKVLKAFTLVQGADEVGGNVSGFSGKLNEAIDLTSQGDSIASADPDKAQTLYNQADDIANQVVIEASAMRDNGILAAQNRMIVVGSELAFLAVLGFVVYRFGPRLFWRLWLRVHGDWNVR